jgi:cell wall-associated NlpC family hydrolase
MTEHVQDGGLVTRRQPNGEEPRLEAFDLGHDRASRPLPFGEQRFHLRALGALGAHDTQVGGRSAVQLHRVLVFGCALVVTLAAGCARLPAPGEPQGPSAASLPGPPGTGAEIASHAFAYLGAPYRAGGTGPAVFDCSGLVRRVYADLGYPLPRSAAEQVLAGQPVERPALEPGDLVFFDTGRKVGYGDRSATHVGIFVGEGRMVHAPGPGATVAAVDLASDYFASHFLAARRIVKP